MNILVNLSPGFFSRPELAPTFERIHSLGTVRTASHNTADEIRADLAWADAVIMWSWPTLTDELLDAAPNLKYAGHIDIGQAGAQVALRRRLPVSVSRHGFSPAVAEMALALILNTLRHVSDYHAAMRASSEQWVRQFPDDINPLQRELTERNVGIVGFGNVGRRLAQLLAPFDCRLAVYDPFVSQSVAAAHGAEVLDLEPMLRRAEIVVLCAASNPGSRHLLGREQIALLRPYAVLVNVARAALVDMEALIDRLRQGDLFAALDVFDHEPLDADSVLRTMPNAYLTPHRAGGIMASVQRILGYLINDLEAVIAGRERQHSLTEKMLPSLDG